MGDSKTYDAIYKIAKSTETDIIHIFMDGAEIKGILLDCEDNKCINGVITLQDVTVICKHTGNEKHYKWFNIPSCHIKAFTFNCCLVD